MFFYLLCVSLIPWARGSCFLQVWWSYVHYSADSVQLCTSSLWCSEVKIKTWVTLGVCVCVWPWAWPHIFAFDPAGNWPSCVCERGLDGVVMVHECVCVFILLSAYTLWWAARSFWLLLTNRRIWNYIISAVNWPNVFFLMGQHFYQRL